MSSNDILNYVINKFKNFERLNYEVILDPDEEFFLHSDEELSCDSEDETSGPFENLSSSDLNQSFSQSTAFVSRKNYLNEGQLKLNGEQFVDQTVDYLDEEGE